MTPYYEQDGITIYHGDCQEVLPAIASVDLVLTDPPYMGLIGGYEYSFDGVAARQRNGVAIGDEWAAGTDWCADAMRVADLGVITFCTHHSVSEIRQAFKPMRAVMLLTWFKRNAPPTGKNVPRFTSEFAWAFAKKPGLTWDRFDSTVSDVPNLPSGCMAVERIVDDGGKPVHPTQKPLALIRDWLHRTSAKSVCDPFSGTGTTLVAAKELGLRAIGIERDERYCELAASRLAQGVLFGVEGVV